MCIIICIGGVLINIKIFVFTYRDQTHWGPLPYKKQENVGLDL